MKWTGWSARSVRGREQEDASEDGGATVSLFASGHTYYSCRGYERERKNAYAVHATFQYGGTPGKKKSNARGKRLDGRGGGILSRNL